MRHLGILGHSAEGAALCFLTFCHAGAGALGPHTHPDVTLDCIAFGPCMPAYERGDHRAVRDVVAVGVARLAAAGADFFACPDNTVHQALRSRDPTWPCPGCTSPRSWQTGPPVRDGGEWVCSARRPPWTGPSTRRP